MPSENQNQNQTRDTTTTTAATDTTTEQHQSKFMTADDFNGAMTARDRRLQQQLAKQFDEFQKSLMAKFAPPDPADPDPADPDPGVQPDPADPAPPQPKRLTGAELAAKKAMAKVEALTKQMAAKEAEAAKEKAELLQRQEKADMIAALSSAGVTTAKGAYATLKEDGRIRRNAEGELVMVVIKDYGGTKAEEEVSIAAGIKDWLATEEGKCFLPARGGGDGSGTVVRGEARRGGAVMNKEEAKKEAQRMLSSFVLGDR